MVIHATWDNKNLMFHMVLTPIYVLEIGNTVTYKIVDKEKIIMICTHTQMKIKITKDIMEQNMLATSPNQVGQ